MDIGLSSICVKIRVCVTSLSGHPFLVVGHLCIFTFLYAFVFTSAFPLLICTSILLGTLFYFRTDPPPVRTLASNVDHSITGSKTEPGDENLYPYGENSSSDSFDSKTATVNSPNFPHSPGGEDEEEEEEKEDGESSSPDASIAGIMPIIDELNPLLEEDSSNPIHSHHISSMGSDLMFEHSPRMSTISSSDSDDDVIENHGEGDQEEDSKSAIVWTEEDQKNLMDLGTSEIERNQRLENLMLRRKRRKNLSMVPEINLIDLEGSNFFPPHIGPISTARKNPFDDSYENSNIPGSAPSVLLQRRNPFDSPFGTGPGQEWLSDSNGAGFQEGFSTFFKGHESLDVGPEEKMRPYFIPEHAVEEELRFQSYHSQSREMIDSEKSSVFETESVVLVEDRSEDPEKNIEKKELSEGQNVTQEPQPISEMNQVDENIGHGNQSTTDDDEEESGDNFPHVGPIYDSSPPVFWNDLASSCGSSEVHGESSHLTLPHVLVKRAVSFAERDSENRLIPKEDSDEEKCSPDFQDSDQEANDRAVFTPAARRSTPMFYDVTMQKRIFENVEEVQVPNTPVESNEKMQTIQNLNIPVTYELDHDTQSPSLGSPLSPDLMSMPSSTNLDIDVQTMQAEVDEIKEIDERISSDLGSIGDFSVTRSSSGSIEVEKHIMDSVGETNHNGDAINLNGIDPMDEIDVSNHDNQNNLSGENEADLQSVENVDSVGPVHEKLIVDDESLIKEVDLDNDRVNSTQTSELHVGETTASDSSSLRPEGEFETKNRDDGAVEVEDKYHEERGESSERESSL